MKKNKALTYFTDILFIILAAAISSLTLHVFVYGNAFTQSGVDGIATMLQYMTGINAGYFSLIFNVPLLIVAWFFLNRKYVFYTLIYTGASSGFQILLAYIGLYQYIADERILAAIIAGLLLGVREGIMLKIGSSTGGIGIAACIIQKKNSHINVEKILAALGYVTILCSIFVYRDISSVLLSFVLMYVYAKGADLMLSNNRDTVEFKIITKNPDEIKQEIIYNLRHGVTVLDSTGAYTGEKSVMLITIVNRRQVAYFLKIIGKHSDTFAYYGNVAGIKGNFRWRPSDEAK